VPDAYERLLLDTVRGNPTLFMRRDEVDAAWTWIQPIIDRWADRRDAPRPYVAGTWGPQGVHSLIERDGWEWNENP
jgi:glucose-6-phosphate 1-dehydrogenase